MNISYLILLILLESVLITGEVKNLNILARHSLRNGIGS